MPSIISRDLRVTSHNNRRWLFGRPALDERDEQQEAPIDAVARREKAGTGSQKRRVRRNRPRYTLLQAPATPTPSGATLTAPQSTAVPTVRHHPAANPSHAALTRRTPPPPPPQRPQQQFDPNEIEYGMAESERQMPGSDMPYYRTDSAPNAQGFPNGMLEAGNGYSPMKTPIELKKPLSSKQMRSVDESSEDSFDNGSYVTDKIQGGPNEGIGWFHAKIKVENSIHWANNYKIQCCMFFIFICGAAMTVAFADNDANASVGLVAGSLITLFCCCAVVYTICDICLVAVLLITELYKCGNGDCSNTLTGASCTATAALTQFFLWTSESWFFVMAIDMLSSLQSPFTDYKSNVRRYHGFVWATGLLTCILLVSIPDFAGESEFGYCWTASKSKLRHDNSDGSDSSETGNLWNLNFQSWLLFYIWLILYWVYAITVIFWAYRRLNSGLSETLRMRLRVLHSVTIYVIAIIIYWGLSFCIYVPFLVQGNERSSWVEQMMNFMITCKGYFDFVVWFQMNDFHEVSKKGKGKKADVDVDVDLSPQVNLALRCEVLYYTTTGIIQAVRDTQHLPPGANQQELYLQPQGTEDNRGSLGVDEYMIRTRPKAALGKGTLFIDYCPHTFQTIREHFGIDTNRYIESLSRTTKERLSEGASGAFMFFSHDQQLIVKSMSDEESVFLRSIAAEYASFLLTNPDSLLTRFYGCHAIRLYGNTFNFVVMANLFSTEKGKRVTCRHCNAKYVFGSTDAENCRARVGRHEPNVILKDNDLTAKVRLDAKVAGELYDQVVKDANFLSRLGIMDYSLLLGIHNVEYMVNPDLEEEPVIPPKDAVGPRRRTINNSTMNGAPLRESKPRQHLPRVATGTRRANTVVGPSIYYFGLIDILQTWNMDKKLERFAKTKMLAKDADGLSAIPPAAYCERFKRKMGEILSVTTRDEYAECFLKPTGKNGQIHIFNENPDLPTSMATAHDNRCRPVRNSLLKWQLQQNQKRIAATQRRLMRMAAPSLGLDSFDRRTVRRTRLHHDPEEDALMTLLMEREEREAATSNQHMERSKPSKILYPSKLPPLRRPDGSKPKSNNSIKNVTLRSTGQKLNAAGDFYSPVRPSESSLNSSSSGFRQNLAFSRIKAPTPKRMAGATAAPSPKNPRTYDQMKTPDRWRTTAMRSNQEEFNESAVKRWEEEDALQADRLLEKAARDGDNEALWNDLFYGTKAARAKTNQLPEQPVVYSTSSFPEVFSRSRSNSRGSSCYEDDRPKSPQKTDISDGGMLPSELCTMPTSKQTMISTMQHSDGGSRAADSNAPTSTQTISEILASMEKSTGVDPVDGDLVAGADKNNDESSGDRDKFFRGDVSDGRLGVQIGVSPDMEIPRWSVVVVVCCLVVGTSGFFMEELMTLVGLFSRRTLFTLSRGEQERMRNRVSALQQELQGFLLSTSEIEVKSQTALTELRQHMDRMRVDREKYQDMLANEMQELRRHVLHATHELVGKERESIQTQLEEMVKIRVINKENADDRKEIAGADVDSDKKLEETTPEALITVQSDLSDKAVFESVAESSVDIEHDHKIDDEQVHVESTSADQTHKEIVAPDERKTRSVFPPDKHQMSSTMCKSQVLVDVQDTKFESAPQVLVEEIEVEHVQEAVATSAPVPPQSVTPASKVKVIAKPRRIATGMSLDGILLLVGIMFLAACVVLRVYNLNRRKKWFEERRKRRNQRALRLAQLRARAMTEDRDGSDEWDDERMESRKFLS
ncbi:Phosphatidylinositol-4-phosphate 5-kinase, N-terminal domain [Phytophthora cactorum]|nr:Phosphatidylinositol-4-phosphate 5-kinase, N-terminal domain [Phytophthora cactorum]